MKQNNKFTSAEILKISNMEMDIKHNLPSKTFDYTYYIKKYNIGPLSKHIFEHERLKPFVATLKEYEKNNKKSSAEFVKLNTKENIKKAEEIFKDSGVEGKPIYNTFYDAASNSYYHEATIKSRGRRTVKNTDPLSKIPPGQAFPEVPGKKPVLEEVKEVKQYDFPGQSSAKSFFIDVKEMDYKEMDYKEMEERWKKSLNETLAKRKAAEQQQIDAVKEATYMYKKTFLKN